jgi:hypothetical protein
MKKYTFVVEATISMNCEVEADSLDEAVELAKEAPIQSLCHQCAKGEPESWNTSGELDFDVTGTSLSEAWEGDNHINVDDIDWD